MAFDVNFTLVHHIRAKGPGQVRTGVHQLIEQLTISHCNIAQWESVGIVVWSSI